MPELQTPIFSFPPFGLDPSQRLVTRNGETISLTPKEFDTLLVLVEAAGRVVDKEELINRVWPDSYVGDGSLARNISVLRKTLGDGVIETHRSRGYRIALPIIASSPFVLSAEALREQESGTARSARGTSGTDGRSALTRSAVWRGLAAIAILLLGLVGGWLWRRAHALTNKDTIVLADFTNTTGDTVFDGTLRQGLSVQLEQSPFLSIIPDQQIQRTLSLMGQKPDARLTPEIARELCQRTGTTAVLNGSITQIGTPYLLTLKAVNCASGESLASAEAQASDKNHVLDALGKTASEIRSKLGESLSTVRKLNTPLEQATTPSLEALEVYSMAQEVMTYKSSRAAIPLFQRAIRLDPNFAIAYAKLGAALNNIGDKELCAENTQKSYALRERVSEPEKFYIESHYDDRVTGNLEKARQTYELWRQIYPRDRIPPHNLGIIDVRLGQLEAAVIELRDGISRQPTAQGYGNLAGSYLRLNRPGEARAVVAEAQANGFDIHDVSKLIAWSEGEPGGKKIFLEPDFETAAYYGQLGKARALSRRAIDSAEGSYEKANLEADAALIEAMFGNPPEARGLALSALGLSTFPYVQYKAALVLALEGDAAKAKALADDLGRRFPEDTIVNRLFLPILHAEFAISRHDGSKAVEVLEAVRSYESANMVQLYPAFLRGEAYLSEHRSSEAAAEFHKILGHRAVVMSFPIGALAHLQIGRAYAMQGDTAKAKAAYQDFLTLWNDADPDIPILKQAKAEYAKLQ